MQSVWALRPTCTRFLRSTRGVPRDSPTLPVVHRGCMSHWRVRSIHLRCQTVLWKGLLVYAAETDSGLVPPFRPLNSGRLLFSLLKSSESLQLKRLSRWFSAFRAFFQSGFVDMQKLRNNIIFAFTIITITLGPFIYAWPDGTVSIKWELKYFAS